MQNVDNPFVLSATFVVWFAFSAFHLLTRSSQGILKLLKLTMDSDTTQSGLPIAPESEDMPWTNVKVLLGKKKAVPGKEEVKRDNLEGADPELCIQYFQRGLNYRGLKNRLKTADQEWIEDFLERDGLTAIFDALTGLGRRGISSVTDALDQLHCVAAVKEVMNRPAGLEYVIEEGSGRSLINSLVLGE